MSVLKRIQELIKNKNMSNRAFELSISKSSGYLKTMSVNGRMPGTEVVLSIVHKYGVNINWLLLGEGNMFPDQVQEEVPSYSKNPTDVQEMKQEITADLQNMLLRMYVDLIDPTPEQVAGSKKLNALFDEMLKQKGK